MKRSVLTVGDLTTTASLDTRVLGGAAGLSRKVLWAHSCEMDDPWRWLGPDELLMTVGLCVPEEPARQRQFISALDDAGLAGIAIGLNDIAPAISPDMIDEANKRGFPLLETGRDTPFASIGRTVAAATTTEQTFQVLKLSKLYHLATFAESDPRTLLRDLQGLLGVGLSVVDNSTGFVIVDGGELRSLDSHEDSPVRSFALPTDRGISLEVTEFPGEELDSFIQVHLLQVVDIAVSRVLRSVRRRVERNSLALQELLNSHLPPGLDAVLGQSTLSAGFQLVAVSGHEDERVGRSIAMAELPALATLHRGIMFIFAPLGSLEPVQALLAKLSIQAAASSTFTDYRDTHFAAIQAAKTLASARGTNQMWNDFEGVSISLLTRSRKEASEIVPQVLGDLARDDLKSAALRETLFCFIRNDRRWIATAQELNIHRQTLSYRLLKIKEITGRDVSSSADLSAFWIAYQGWPSYSGLEEGLDR